MTTSSTLTTPSSWSLRSKLLASVIALFVVVSLAIGTVTVVATKAYLVGSTDAELRATAERIERSGDLAPPDRGDPRGGGPGGSSSSLTVLSAGEVVYGSWAVTLTNEPTTLTTEQLTLLLNAGLSTRPTEVDLGGQLGTYRLIQAQTPEGVTVTAGLRTGSVDSTVQALAWMIGLGVLTGSILVGLLGSIILRRSLAPLQRVAGTAARVSRLKLDSGDVTLGVRVPEEDASPTTEVGAVGLALNTMLDTVENALQARQESETRVRRFVADASHELRTPLSSIRGYAELSRRVEGPVPPEITHALDRVTSESVRMQGLVEELLLLARLDSGRALERLPVDLSAMLVGAVSDAHAASPEHVWSLDLPDEPVEVIGDTARLHAVVVNLLANARTHTPPGTTVLTRLRSDGAHVTLEVRDDGPGIPEDLLPHVFERFRRGDESRTRSGASTGLGLSIVSAVVDAHGGSVSVTSRPGETVFSVVLPC